MAKAKQANGKGGEKKLRKRLQQAEENHIKAQQQLEKAQVMLGKAATRLERRTAALAEARSALNAHLSPPVESESGSLVLPGTPKEEPATTPAMENQADGAVAGARTAPTRRPRRAAASNDTDQAREEETGAGQSIEEKAGTLGIIVP